MEKSLEEFLLFWRVELKNKRHLLNTYTYNLNIYKSDGRADFDVKAELKESKHLGENKFTVVVTKVNHLRASGAIPESEELDELVALSLVKFGEIVRTEDGDYVHCYKK